MRNIISALGVKKLTILLLPLLLISCFGEDDKVRQAKKDLGVINEEITTSNSGTTIKEEEIVKEVEKEKEKKVKIERLTENKFISLNDVSEKALDFFEVEISGTTLEKIDKIGVEFSNKDSDYPDDNYTLEKFKSGDDSFVYRASSKYQVFDYGVNEYIFTAYAGDEKSQIKLTLIKETEEEKSEKKEEVTKKDEEKEVVSVEITNHSYEKKMFGKEDNSVYISFPKSDNFGEVVMTGDDSFTYSKINGLEVNKTFVGDINCGNLTEHLQEKLSSWFFWNTCRDIVKDKGISFYVIRLEGENYVYEKHYLDQNHGLYGIYELAIGDGVDKDTISNKNDELKEKNEEYEISKVVDLLFTDLVR